MFGVRPRIKRKHRYPSLQRFTQPRRVLSGLSQDPSGASRLPWYWRAVIVILLLISFGSAAAWWAPELYYQTTSQEEGPELVATQIVRSEPDSDLEQLQQDVWQPPVSSNLPEGEWVVIPRIGVRTQLQQTEDPDEALQTGVWWVPDFGQPGDRELPMILAAHRFGFRWMWDRLLTDGTSYATRNIFYDLPELEQGDLVEVIADQRRYIYRVYYGEATNRLTDYTADLILYTCKHLNSPIRHVRYAELLPVTDQAYGTDRVALDDL